MSIQNSLVAGLTKAANFYAQKLASKIREVNAPSRMADEITIDQAIVNGNTASIEISIADPAAAAFEFGSGIHATKGQADKYLIFPKEQSALAFDWIPESPEAAMNSPKFIGFGGDGRWIFSYVEHPGVAPRPFMHPTLVENKQEMAKIIGREFSSAILAEVRATIRGQ